MMIDDDMNIMKMCLYVCVCSYMCVRMSCDAGGDSGHACTMYTMYTMYEMYTMCTCLTLYVPQYLYLYAC